MKKFLVLLVTVTMLSACTALTKKPSVCETQEGPSYLCEVAAKNHMRIEDVGNSLIVANALAISAGYYSPHQAIVVLEDVRSVLDRPVSYAFFKGELRRAAGVNPGMIDILGVFVDDLISSRVMYTRDRVMLQNWINARIESLEALR